MIYKRKMASDGRNCAGRWEKMRRQMGEIALQMGEIALPDGRNCAAQMGEIALNCREGFETPQNTPKNAFFDAQNGGKMGFLRPKLGENARQMGEIALKMAFNRVESVPNDAQNRGKMGCFELRWEKLR